ncbi:MAG: YraN family protein [Chitinophagales bacterium]
MPNKQAIGSIGEAKAVDFLLDLGYEILYKNWRYKKSEIDIIALDKNSLVFVEVKLRKVSKFGFPETTVSDNKIKKMHEAADAYIAEHNWQGELRFDIIAISQTNDTYTIAHFVDAFY